MATISNVAKRAKVSIATVSRVLNNESVVSPETAEKVKQAIKELGYTPNQAGRMLKRGNSKTIYVLSSITAPSDALQTSMQSYADKKGLTLAFLSYIGEKDSQWTGIRSYGAFFVNPELVPPDKLRDFTAQTPTVILCSQPDMAERMKEDFPLAEIILDNHMQLYYEMAKHLLANGIRRIAYPVVYDYAKETIAVYSLNREAGIRKAAEEFGVPAENMIGIPIHDLPKKAIKDGGLKFGRQVAEKFLEMNCPAEAIICNTDRAAIGCIRNLMDHGVRVPEDVLVSGFDGEYISRFYIPSITSFFRPFDAIVIKTIDLLMKKNIGEGFKESPLPPTSLVLRESTDFERFRK